MAEVLKRSKSAISKELSRNCGRRGYRPKQAHSKSVERQSINARTHRRCDMAIHTRQAARAMESGADKRLGSMSGQYEKIDVTLEITPRPSSTHLTYVQKLRSAGESRHKIGKHKESVETLSKADDDPRGKVISARGDRSVWYLPYKFYLSPASS